MTVGVVGFALQSGWIPALSFLAQEPSYVLSSTDLAAVPLFLMMGVFASMAGFSEDVYRAAAAFLGHRRGGLAYATISGSAAFGANRCSLYIQNRIKQYRRRTTPRNATLHATNLPHNPRCCLRHDGPAEGCKQRGKNTQFDAAESGAFFI